MKKVELFYTNADYEKFLNTKLSILNSDEYDLKKMHLFAESSEQKIENKKSQKIRKLEEKCERVEKKEIPFFPFDISINSNKLSQLKSEQKESPLSDEEKATGDDSKNSEIIQQKEDCQNEIQVLDYSFVEEIDPLFAKSFGKGLAGREEDKNDNDDQFIVP